MKMPAVTTEKVERGGKKLPCFFPCLQLFVLALVVRLIGITWGLPDASRWYSYHPDESSRQIVGAVSNLLQGDFNPHFFNYPSLTVYATWLFYWLLTLAGSGTPGVSSGYPWPQVHDIILAGRLFSAVCGALTAPVIFLMARRLNLGKWTIVAAIFAALAPGHVQQSHFATVDVPATFFVTLCLLLAMRASNWKGFLAAGLVAGLAAGTKYNAGLVLLAPITALWWPTDMEKAPGKRVLLTLALVAIAAFGFLLSTPYALITPGEFWGDPSPQVQSGISYELLVHPREGSSDIFKGTGNGWIYHLTFNLPFLLTWPIVIAAAVGIYFAAKERKFWPLLGFLGFFFLSLGLSQVRFMRYLLPLVPGLCLLAAFGTSQVRYSKVWGTTLGVFILIGCWNVLYPFCAMDPRDQARASTGNQRVALEEQPWFFTPPYGPGDRTTPQIPGAAANFDVLNRDIEKLHSPNDPFVVQSEVFARERERLGTTDEFDKQLKALYPVRKDFKNAVPLALPGRAFVPHDYLYTNPETRVYSRR